jgi:hypothetical protein
LKRKSNCIICKRRKKCINYQIAGVFADPRCDDFEEE